MEGGDLHFEGGDLRTELSLLGLLVGAKNDKLQGGGGGLRALVSGAASGVPLFLTTLMLNPILSTSSFMIFLTPLTSQQPELPTMLCWTEQKMTKKN